MVNILKKNKELLILIGILLALAICLEAPSWIKGGYFVGGGDIKTQWYPFYVLNRRETINAIKSGSFPFYSWVLFLGNNIWASKPTYGLFDIFNILFYLCRKNYFWIYDAQIIIKIVTAGIIAYLLINNIFNNKKAGLLGGLLYASSSFMLYFSSQSGFMSFAALAPLYLLGIVLFIKENKKILFIISTALLFLTNYYLFFALTILSPFIFSYCYYNIKGDFNGVVKKIFIIIGLYLVGFSLTGIFVIPSFLYLLQIDRVGSFNNNLLIYPNIKLYLSVLYSMFTPSQVSIYGNNVFNFNEHTYKELCLFSATLVPVLFSQIFTIKNNKFKYSSLALEGLFILILFVPIFGSVLNGFSEVCFRWTYLFILLNIIISLYCLFVEKEIIIKPLIIFSIDISLMLLVIFFLGIFISNFKFSDYYIQFCILIAIILFIAAYNVCLIFNKKLIYVVLGVELLVTSIFFGYKNLITSINDNDLLGVNSVLTDEYSESLKDHLVSLDDKNQGLFFRTHVDYDDLYWAFSRNFNLIYDIEGTMSYDSTFEPSFSDMYSINKEGIIKDIDWEYSIDDPSLLNFISCKYALTLTEDKIPFDNYKVVEPNYRGGIIISENLDYEPIGVTYSSRVDSTNDFSSLSKEIVSDDKEIDNYLLSKQKNVLEQVYYYNNRLEASIKSDDVSFVVMKLSYDKGFKVKVNGTEKKTHKCNGGMLGFPIEKGTNTIEIDFVPEGFKIGAVISIIGFISFVVIIIFEIKNQSKRKIA